MNNEQKTSISHEATAKSKSPSPTRMRTRSQIPSPTTTTPTNVINAEIRNFPDNITMTPEILKKHICRTCATYYDPEVLLIPLYVDNEVTRSLVKLIHTLLPIRLQRNDGLSEVLCRTCVTKLHEWRALWESCVDVQKLLQSQAELLDGNQSRADSRTLHFVDLMDSTDEENDPGEESPSGEWQYLYVLGAWAR